MRKLVLFAVALITGCSSEPEECVRAAVLTTVADSLDWEVAQRNGDATRAAEERAVRNDSLLAAARALTDSGVAVAIPTYTRARMTADVFDRVDKAADDSVDQALPRITGSTARTREASRRNLRQHLWNVFEQAMRDSIAAVNQRRSMPARAAMARRDRWLDSSNAVLAMIDTRSTSDVERAAASYAREINPRIADLRMEIIELRALCEELKS